MKSAQNIFEFCVEHSISRSKIYEEIHAGRIQVMKVGRRTLISAEAAAAWRRLCEARAPDPGPPDRRVSGPQSQPPPGRAQHYPAHLGPGMAAAEIATADRRGDRDG